MPLSSILLHLLDVISNSAIGLPSLISFLIYPEKPKRSWK
jgi:hypothetical protein